MIHHICYHKIVFPAHFKFGSHDLFEKNVIGTQVIPGFWQGQNQRSYVGNLKIFLLKTVAA